MAIDYKTDLRLWKRRRRQIIAAYRKYGAKETGCQFAISRQRVYQLIKKEAK